MSETQSSVRIGLLGGFGCSHCDGGELAVQSRKVRGVLAYLALARGKRAVRDELAATFWPSAGEQQARQSLRQSLTVLRKALNAGGREVLSADAADVALDAGAVAVDVDEVLRGLDSDDEAVVLAAAPHVGGALLAFSFPALLRESLRTMRLNDNEAGVEVVLEAIPAARGMVK